MKILVVYYSRSGNTKKAAEEISKDLKCDIDEISENKSRKGMIGWLGAGRDAMRKKEVEIKFEKDLSKYDLIIVGTPIWASTAVPAVRSYLIKNQDKLKSKKIAFFSTSGGTRIDRVAEDMEKLSEKPIATLSLFAKGNNLEKIKDFCEKVKSKK
ncbi:MAG: flavodoxin [Candidatus Pacearchaeota archaeon]|jgi:flavodoxin